MTFETKVSQVKQKKHVTPFIKRSSSRRMAGLANKLKVEIPKAAMLKAGSTKNVLIKKP